MHAALDSRFAVYDLTRPGDLGVLLGAQAAAFDAMSRAGHTGIEVAKADIADLVRRADADMAVLGLDRPQLPLAASADPVAVDYVVLGSRLGSKMLARIWAGGDDPTALAAGSYFGAPDMAAAWRRFCDTARSRPATGAAADRCLSDALALFALFDAALTETVALDARREVAV